MKLSFKCLKRNFSHIKLVAGWKALARLQELRQEGLYVNGVYHTNQTP